MTVKRLLIISLVVLVASLAFAKVMGNPNNRISYACVPNVDQRAFDTLQHIYGPDQNAPDQNQRFCPAGQHPELTEKWETINRYVLYAALATGIPVLLCTFEILGIRFISKL